MLVTSIIPGDPLRVACDLTATQIAACAHALRSERDVRYRVAELSVDETLALRELTALIDAFAVMGEHGASDTVQLSVARLVLLRDAIRDHVVALGEREVATEADRLHERVAAALIDPLSDLVEQALQAAFTDGPTVDVDPSDFDSLLGH